MARGREQNDQRLTVFLSEGAVAGRVIRFTETGLVAVVEAPIPRDEVLRFSLHLQGRVIGGEISSLGQEGRECRLQFAALTERDRQRLEPFIDPDA